MKPNANAHSFSTEGKSWRGGARMSIMIAGTGLLLCDSIASGSSMSMMQLLVGVWSESEWLLERLREEFLRQNGAGLL